MCYKQYHKEMKRHRNNIKTFIYIEMFYYIIFYFYMHRSKKDKEIKNMYRLHI